MPHTRRHNLTSPYSPLSWRFVAGLAIVAHTLLALLYSVVIPPWEAHDEWAHYKYAEYVARYWRLPPQNQRLTTEYEFDEATQPPLYYILAALPVALALPDDGYRPVVNPYADTGRGEGGINFAVHDPRVERFPWQGTILALRLARLVSVLISTLGLWFTWKLGGLLAPNRPWVPALATTFHALVPQYIFIGSVVTNDILQAVMTGIVTYLLVRLVLVPPRLQDGLWLGIALLLAFLTKYLALALLLPGLVVALLGFLQARSRWQRWLIPTLVALLLLVGGGGWMYRNVRETGVLIPRDPYAVARITGTSPWELIRALDWKAVPAALVYGFRTLWASFGWGNLEPGVWVTWLFALAVGLAGLGWARRVVRGEGWPGEHRGSAVILFLMAAVVALPLLRELIHASALLRGRYLLGVLTGLSVLLALGWDGLLTPRDRGWTTGLLFAGLVALNLYSALYVIRPAYRPQGLLTEAQVLEILQDPNFHPVNARFDDALELVAYDPIPNDGVQEGQYQGVTLLWHVLRPLPENYTISVHVVGRDHVSYGWVGTYPARGSYASTLWQPNTWFLETYWVPVSARGSLPTLGRFGVALFLDRPDAPHLPAYDSQGNPLGGKVFFGRLRLDPAPERLTPPPPPSCPLNARLGDLITLEGVTMPTSVGPETGIPLVLSWAASGTPPGDLTVFLHLLDERGVRIEGADAPPQGGAFPTGIWRAGDRVADAHRLPWPEVLAPGTYTLVTGLYDPTTGARLPALAADGARLPTDAVPLARVRVGPEGKVALECGSPAGLSALPQNTFSRGR